MGEAVEDHLFHEHVAADGNPPLLELIDLDDLILAFQGGVAAEGGGAGGGLARPRRF